MKGLKITHCTKNEVLRIWSHLLKKSLMENLIFCARTKTNECSGNYHLKKIDTLRKIKDTEKWTSFSKWDVFNKIKFRDKTRTCQIFYPNFYIRGHACRQYVRDSQFKPTCGHWNL